jgi:putative peptidoglycan lipid II flippase
MLNCFKRFFIYSLSPIFYNLAIIFGAAILAPKYGVIGVVYAVVAGSFLHLVIIIPSIVKLGYRYKPILSFTDENVVKIIKLMIPRSISMGAGQIMLVVYTAIASALAFGSISAFTLANNIQSVPVMVLGSAFSSAIFPTLAIKIAQKKEKEFAFYLNRALRAIGYFLIPSTFVFIILRAQIVRLLYGSGKFDWNDTKMTALALGFFSLSILAQGLIPLFSRAFYAMKNTKTPMYCSIATVIVSIIIAFPLAKYYSVAGLALAFTIGSYFNTFTLSYFLNKKYPGILDKNLLRSYTITFVISLAMGVAVWSSMHIASNYVDMTRFFGVLTQSIIACISGAAVFFTLSYFFDQEEMKWAVTRKINGGLVNNK